MMFNYYRCVIIDPIPITVNIYDPIPITVTNVAVAGEARLSCSVVIWGAVADV